MIRISIGLKGTNSLELVSAPLGHGRYLKVWVVSMVILDWQFNIFDLTDHVIYRGAILRYPPLIKENVETPIPIRFFWFSFEMTSFFCLIIRCFFLASIRYWLLQRHWPQGYSPIGRQKFPLDRQLP